jgi:formylglycine-generating enzyme required for sulfatase activity
LGIVLAIQTGHHVPVVDGTVKIVLSDPEAQVVVKVDGDVIDIAGLKDPLRLKAGEHDLLVTSGDYQTVSKSFTVRRGGEEVIQVALEPKPRPATFAVVVDPPQAEVAVAGKGASIEGSDAARTITVAEPDGQAKVTVIARLAGHKTLVEELQPQPGESRRLTLRLIEKRPAETAEEPLPEPDGRSERIQDSPQLAGQSDRRFVAVGERSGWSPDGKKIVFGRGGNNNGGILIYDIATHKATELTSAGKDPAWAGKDGRWIAYVVESGGPETIWAAEVPDGKPFRVATGSLPSCAADGKTLFFQAFDRNQLMSVEVTGKGRFSPPRLRSAVPYHYPAVSPDGKRVAYKSGGDLVIQQVDDGKVAKRFVLPKGSGILGGWSPDSREFGFGGFNADDPMPSIILDVETGLARQVASRSLTLPAWSPDGSKITFDLRLSTGTEIWMLDAEAIKKLPTFKIAVREPAAPYDMVVSAMPRFGVAEKGVHEPAAPWKIQAVPPQTVQAGKPLRVALLVEDAERWKGKLQYSLAPGAPPGAAIDRQTGAFTWTPPRAWPAGQHRIGVSAAGPEGQTFRTSFIVTVTRPIPVGAGLADEQISVDLGDGVTLAMVLIPAGEFLMGSPDAEKDASSGEKPQHRVRITKPFYLGKCLVTQEQWQAVVGGNPSRFKGPQNPVERVSWQDCQAFLGKLNAKVGRPHPGPLPVGQGEFRLPTEAQWEYACRAGSTTSYCFGDDQSQLGAYAWYNQNSDDKTHPVGEKKPNAWGFYDMHGNVWEWCQDWHDEGYYAKSPMDNPTGPATGLSRVFRGGGWNSDARGCRSANRGRLSPGAREDHLGLRVSLVPTE